MESDHLQILMSKSQQKGKNTKCCICPKFNTITVDPKGNARKKVRLPEKHVVVWQIDVYRFLSRDHTDHITQAPSKTTQG